MGLTINLLQKISCFPIANKLSENKPKKYVFILFDMDCKAFRDVTSHGVALDTLIGGAIVIS